VNTPRQAGESYPGALAFPDSMNGVEPMANTTLELKHRPQFTKDAKGKPTAVKLDTAAYITLLVRANVTDPALWPPRTQQGAAALARVRGIEADCTTRHGKFDWEKLPEAVQNEYDDLCALLDRLQDTGERLPLDGYKRKRAEKPS
jgi:hypothetical protein